MPIFSARSFGSLAALAAASLASQALAAPATSAIANIPMTELDDPINGLTHLDIDGNGTDDFDFDFVNSDRFSLQSLAANNGIAGNTAISADGAFRFAEGASIASGATYNQRVRLEGGSPADIVGLGVTYVGIRFEIGAGQMHYGWIRFNFPDADSANGALEAAAWETAPDTAIFVPFTAVPEPASSAFALALGLAGWALWRHRKPAAA